MFPQLLARLAEALERHRIPYMVIGGQAVLAHGEPRLTKDIDLTLGVDTTALPTVLEVVREIGLEPLVDPQPFVLETLVLPCRDLASLLRVDLIFSHSPYEEEAIRRAVSIRIGDALVKFVSPEDLIIHKVLAGRPRDLEDAHSVLVKNPSLDRSRIEHWLRHFEAALSEAFLARWAQVQQQR